MNYSISSDKFSNPLLKSLLQTLSIYFEHKGLAFYVIGATARDIIMRQLLDQQSLRRTQDLDIAIAISNWDKFEEIATEIAQMESFEKSTHQIQRFIYQNVYELDIVPFGTIAKEDSRLVEQMMKQSYSASYKIVRQALMEISSILQQAISNDK